MGVMLGGYTVINLASHAAGMDGGGFLHYGRYRGITAGLEWGGIMLRGLLRLHILPGLLPLLLLRRILAFCFFPAQKLWLFFWG